MRSLDACSQRHRSQSAPIRVGQVDQQSELYTDDAGQYCHMDRDFNHEAVRTSAAKTFAETRTLTPSRTI